MPKTIIRSWWIYYPHYGQIFQRLKLSMWMRMRYSMTWSIIHKSMVSWSNPKLVPVIVPPEVLVHGLLMRANLYSFLFFYFFFFGELIWGVLCPTGIVETQKGCCGTGLVEAGPMCNSRSSICGKPSQYIFWDCIHPTDAAYKHLAQKLVRELIPKLEWKSFILVLGSISPTIV